jgi:hypothetical protein
MKSSAFILTFFASQVTALQGLAGYASDIPSCAYAAFTSAVAKEGCSTTDVNASEFDCLCSHLGGISYDVGMALFQQGSCAAGMIRLYCSPREASRDPQ